MPDGHSAFQSSGARIPFAEPVADVEAELRLSALKGAFLQALLAGNVHDAMAVSAGIRSVDMLMHFYRRVVQPAMYDVGQLWELGKISVAREHAASSIVSRVMASLHAELIVSRVPTKGRAVVSATTNEYHELGAWIVSDMLELDGWEIRYLGANAPVTTILTMLVRFKPHLLALSVTMPDNVEYARGIITALRNEPLIAGTKVIAGGAAMNAVSGLWRDIGADGHGGDVEEAVAYAGSLWERLSNAERL